MSACARLCVHLHLSSVSAVRVRACESRCGVRLHLLSVSVVLAQTQRTSKTNFAILSLPAFPRLFGKAPEVARGVDPQVETCLSQ